VQYICVLCLYGISNTGKKETIDVGCKLKVRDRGVVYVAKV